MFSGKYLLFLVIVLVNFVSVFPRILKPSELKPKLIVPTTSGLLQGVSAGFTSGKHRTIYRFRGIPYAEPPVGVLRFEPAVPKAAWNGVLDASELTPFCTQGSEQVLGSEDCLYVKIYTTKLPKKKWRMPVLVWFYGGGFYEGNPDFDKHSPKHLLDEDLMVVSFNYRVSIFGFLSTNDSVVPGNIGLKDQLFALKWIKENIENFGGDPNKITLMGQSAGAASIGYLLASKKIEGLINGAIMLSGNPFNQWALARQPLEFATTVASYCGLNTTTDTRTLVNYLKAIPAETLQRVAYGVFQKMLVSNPFHGLPFAPVIEPEHEHAIYSGNYHDLLQRGQIADIPILMGHTSLEAGPEEINAMFKMILPQFDVLPEKLVPVSMNLRSGLDTVGRIIKSEYFGEQPVATSYLNFKKFISDDQFTRGIWEAVRLYSLKVPVYFYQFSYQGELSGVTNRIYPGVGHTEELSYIFETGNNGTEQDYLIRKRMVAMIANFATIFNPTPAYDALLQHVVWKPNNEYDNDIYQLDIGSDLKMVKNPRKSVNDFWLRLFQENGEPPFSTY